jgi:hypothetical protein
MNLRVLLAGLAGRLTPPQRIFRYTEVGYLQAQITNFLVTWSSPFLCFSPYIKITGVAGCPTPCIYWYLFLPQKKEQMYGNMQITYIKVFWDVALCCFESNSRRFEEWYCYRIVGKYLTNDRSHPRRLQYLSVPLWEPQFSHYRNNLKPSFVCWILSVCERR